MKITILGSGSSIGAPVIGCSCKVCVSTNPKNHRSRASIFIELKEGNLLVDTSPDLRMQALKNKITKVDKVLFTHAHADHIAGIDDLRCFNHLRNGSIEVFGTEETLGHLQHSYQYCFAPMKSGAWNKPMLDPVCIKDEEMRSILGHEIYFINLPHGYLQSTSIKIDKFCFSTDFKSIPAEKEYFFQGLDVWVVDCLKPETSPGHLSIGEALAFVEKFKPKKTILFHLAHEIEYEELGNKLPKNIVVGYDGMVINTTG